jgi:hypothetical protein
MWTLANSRIQAVVVCLLIALVYAFMWPGRKEPERVRRRALWARIVLRWFHSLTWVLIAIACLFWNRVAAGSALVVYLVFIVALNRDRRPSAP